LESKISFKYLLKDLGISSINNLVITAVGFFISIKIANELGTEIYGMYSYYLTIAALIGIVINFGTDKLAAIYFEKINDIQLVFNAILTVRFYLFIISIIISFLVFDFIIFLSILCINISSFNLSFVFELDRNNRKFSYLYLIERLLYYVLIVLILFFLELNIELILLSIALASFIGIIIQITLNINLLKKFELINIFIYKLNFLDNILITIIFFSEFAYGGISKIFLEDKLDFESLGIFSAGMQIIMLISIFQSQVEKVFRPLIYNSINKGKVSFYSSVRKYLSLTTIPVILFSILFYALGAVLIDLLFNSEYKDISKILLELSIYAILINIKSLVGIIYVGFDKVIRFTIVSLVFSVLLILSFYFSPSNLSINYYFFIILIFLISNYVFMFFDTLKILKNRYEK